MKNEPLVSVVMCVYNEEEYMIEEAVQAIFEQTYRNWELVIVYDNPENVELKCFIEKIAKRSPRIRVYYNEQNLGTAETKRRGVYSALGEYAAVADADDVSMPLRLSREMEYLVNHGCDMVCSAYHVINESGEYIRQGRPDISERQLMAYMPYINEICHSTVIYKKNVFVALDGYRKLPYVEDYDLWMRMLITGHSIGYLTEDLIAYRERQSSLTYKKNCIHALMDAYVRQSYKSYRKTGCYERDDMKYEDLLLKYHADDLKVQQTYANSVKMRQAAGASFLQRRYLHGSVYYMKAVLGSRIYRLNVYNSIEFKLKKLFGLCG